MNEGTTFGVVITSYNYRDYVVEAVQGVLAQTRAAAQVVVVDDGSGDIYDARADVDFVFSDMQCFDQRHDITAFHPHAVELGYTAWGVLAHGWKSRGA